MEINEGNRIIAEFMETPTMFPRVKLTDGSVYKVEVLPEYHSSWDWLHPVLEKIWGLGSWEYLIANNCCTIYGEHEQPPYINGQGVSTIESTWSAVTQFIQWYTLTPK